MYNYNSAAPQSFSAPMQAMSAEDGRKLTELVHVLLAKVDHFQESLNKLQISNGSQSDASSNRFSNEDVQSRFLGCCYMRKF